VPELLPLYATILHGHRDGEEHFLFPALRAAGRMRSSDVAFLNARAHEHLATSPRTSPKRRVASRPSVSAR
jgi:hypothetical protein